MARSVPTTIHVGTAGWSLPTAQASAFPGGASHLVRYAQVFTTVEINSTFWRRHRPSTFERWHDAVPPGFIFAVKLSRSITHEASLASPTKALREFFSDVAPLRAKLGPVLVQLPAMLSYQARRARTFFRTLRSMHEGAVACEPRGESWYSEHVTELFDEYDVSRVIADPPRPPAACEPAGSRRTRYLRLHGSPRRYYSSYDEARLRQFAEVMGTGKPRTTYCIFDNTASGAAVGDALAMLKLIR